MRRLISFALLIAFTTTGCDKSEVEKNEQVPMPVTNRVKTGDWMVTYIENNASMDMGLTFLKFNSTGTLVATKDGTRYNGVWTEANTSGNNTLTINITTSDTKLQKANKTWKVTGTSECFQQCHCSINEALRIVTLRKLIDETSCYILFAFCSYN